MTSIVKAYVLMYKMPMLYCNTVGSQTEIVFDGGSLVYDISGHKVKEMNYFEEDYQVFDLEKLLTPEDPGVEKFSDQHAMGAKKVLNKIEAPTARLVDQRTNTEGRYYYSAFDVGRDMDTIEYLVGEKNTDEIYHAIILGIRDYFGKMGFSKAILGSAGGIDSAVTQVLAVEALGKENVRALLMPSQYSSSHSVAEGDALKKKH